ncbi:PaaI family thioesterase [Gordonibacter sp. An230]|uniref:PaaI family thioesterase n=1 Tax=Gordonibacter sp. An230 TaxID=1965592 RepID=UPI00111D300E|nr:PaaI family thioesterase [Gordonibacter sp. An230]
MKDDSESLRVEEGALPPYLREGCLNHLSDLGGFEALRNDLLRRGYVRNRVKVPQDAANLFRRAHGGFLMFLVDVTACMAGYSMGKHNVTQHVSLDFVRGVSLGDELAIEARVLHDGRTTALVDTRVLDSVGRLCVKASCTLFYVGAVDSSEPPPKPYLGRNPGVR